MLPSPVESVVVSWIETVVELSVFGKGNIQHY